MLSGMRRPPAIRAPSQSGATAILGLAPSAFLIGRQELRVLLSCLLIGCEKRLGVGSEWAVLLIPKLTIALC